MSISHPPKTTRDASGAVSELLILSAYVDLANDTEREQEAVGYILSFLASLLAEEATKEKKEKEIRDRLSGTNWVHGVSSCIPGNPPCKGQHRGPGCWYNRGWKKAQEEKERGWINGVSSCIPGQPPCTEAHMTVECHYSQE